MRFFIEPPTYLRLKSPAQGPRGAEGASAGDGFDPFLGSTAPRKPPRLTRTKCSFPAPRGRHAGYEGLAGSEMGTPGGHRPLWGALGAP